MLTVLGISAFYHDSAACIVQDGVIIAAAQEERFTRKKHDSGFPYFAARYCMKQAGVTADQIDAVAFYDKPFIKFNRILETFLAHPGKGYIPFLKAIPNWIGYKLWIPDIIKKKLGYSGLILYPEHHESHAASAFFPSPFSRAAFLTVDGVGEWATSSFGIGEENKIIILAEQHFPHSLGLLYSAFTYFTGFKVNSGEYKVMGLAPYGEPKYVQKIYDHLIDLKEDGSMAMNMEYFNYATGLTMTNDKFARLFDGPPRKSEDTLTQREMDLARSLQDVTDEVLLRMAHHVMKETGEEQLCLAGGVALNCVANGKLLREGVFRDIWIQPAAGDAGGALGAALASYHCHFNKQVPEKHGRDRQMGSYLGTSYKDQDIKEFLEGFTLPFYEYQNPTDLHELLANLMISGKVIGLFQGRMEFGPRALGNRSIIGDARSPEMQKKMNLKIKFRESFRPFAPSVLADHISDWFEIDRESPYMLLVANVKKEKQRKMTHEEEQLWGIDKLNIVRSEIPAVTHIDYSARIQSVNRLDNPEYYDIIHAFYEKTGCPVIVNTSFNVRGEPIVESPLDAYRCFMRTEMDVLVLNQFVLFKEDQPEFHDAIDWKQVYELD